MEKFFLKNPPIEQAAIEIIIETPAEKSFKDLKRVKDRLKADYPIDMVLRQQAIEFKFEEQKDLKGSMQDLGEFGHQLWSSDKKTSLQVRMDGLLLTRSAPYENWEACFSHFEKALQIYCEEIVPKKVRRISARFINRMELEVGKPIEAYLKIPLPVPAGVTGVKVAHITSRVTYEDSRIGLTGTIIQMTAPSTETAEKFQCILDIDVGKISEMETDMKAIKAGFDQIRAYKNQLFIDSVTADVLARYQ
jgi:uncharacterized protein (TIGR04255 family)